MKSNDSNMFFLKNINEKFRNSFSNVCDPDLIDMQIHMIIILLENV